MKTVAIIIEQNVKVPGKTINDCWFPLVHPDFSSASEAIMWSVRFNVANQNRLALRVLERIRTDQGRMVDHQIFPHWQPQAREFATVSANVPAPAGAQSLIGSDHLSSAAIDEKPALRELDAIAS